MLSRSMEAARSLLQALALGAGAAAAAEETLRESDSEHCVTAVLKAVACARCKGLDVRPCRSYCLNVVRGYVLWNYSVLLKEDLRYRLEQRFPNVFTP